MTKNKPGRRSPIRYLDKNEAAEYLGYTSANIRYHLYTSKLLVPGRILYGRRVWTIAELETLRNRIKKARQEPKPGQVTAAALVSDETMLAAFTSGKMKITYKGMTILKIERDFNQMAQYWLTVKDDADCAVWGNTLLTYQ